MIGNLCTFLNFTHKYKKSQKIVVDLKSPEKRMFLIIHY